MSSTNGKRIPKRSIIGSAVSVQTRSGFWRNGTIVAARSDENRLIPLEKKFEVQLTEGEECYEKYYKESQIYGPGFLNNLPTLVKLNKGQEVYVTHNGREIKAEVQSHDTTEDCLELYSAGVGTIFKSLDEIRLLQSRKSARLVNSDTDFSRMADVCIAQQRRKVKDGRRRLHSMSCFPDHKTQLPAATSGGRVRPTSETSGRSSGPYSTANIDVPNSRKRRTSESRLELESGYSSSICSSIGGHSSIGGFSSSLSSSILSASLLRSAGVSGEDFASSFLKSKEDLGQINLQSTEDVRDCTAAMVLMNLSVSPGDRWRDLSSVIRPPFSSSPSTPQPSPASSPPNTLMEEDEEPSRKHQRSSTVVYCCTWRGCTHRSVYQSAIETHVRQHLGRPEPKDGEERDFEEEFYYTEIDNDEQPSSEDYIDIMEADIIIDNNTPPPLPAFAEHNYVNPQPLQPSTDQTLHKTQPQVTSVGEKPLPQTFGDQSSSVRAQPSFSFGQSPRVQSSGGSPPSIMVPSAAAPPPPGILASSAPSSVSLLRYIPSGLSEHLDMVKSPALFIIPDSQKQRGEESGKKLVSIVPKPEKNGRAPATAKPFIFTPTPPYNVIKSDRKCRKIYGLDGKDEWCTQCKWKKACARFS